MNLERDWLFTEAFFRVGYVSTAIPHRDYNFLLVSDCQMNNEKVGELAIYNFISKLLHSGQNMVVFCSTASRFPLIILYSKYVQWVDFKIESIFLLETNKKFFYNIALK